MKIEIPEESKKQKKAKKRRNLHLIKKLFKI